MDLKGIFIQGRKALLIRNYFIMPRAGGRVVYLDEAYHPAVGFMAGFSDWLIGGPGSVAAVALALMGVLRSSFLDISDFGVKMGAVVIIIAATLYNLFGVKIASSVQSISMLGIHYAVNHPVPQNGVTLQEALRMYTYNGAIALCREREIGSLAPGKKADIVILDRDITQTDAVTLKDVVVEMTIKGGDILFDRRDYA